MTYQPPAHLQIVLTGRAATNREVAFWAEAVKIQLREHAAPAWGLAPPGVSVCTADAFIPSAEGMILVVADDDGDDEAAGWHNPLGGIVDLHQSGSPSRTLSHEALEMLGNWAINRWSSPDRRGRRHALEICDAVQRTSYTIRVTLFGETRDVEVSDFVLPEWFVLGSPGPFSYMGAVGAPFEIAPGGYSIALDGEDVVYLAHPDGADFPARKVSPKSRTSRILRRAA